MHGPGCVLSQHYPPYGYTPHHGAEGDFLFSRIFSIVMFILISQPFKWMVPRFAFGLDEKAIFCFLRRKEGFPN